MNKNLMYKNYRCAKNTVYRNYRCTKISKYKIIKETQQLLSMIFNQARNDYLKRQHILNSLNTDPWSKDKIITEILDRYKT